MYSKLFVFSKCYEITQVVHKAGLSKEGKRKFKTYLNARKIPLFFFPFIHVVQDAEERQTVSKNGHTNGCGGSMNLVHNQGIFFF